MVFITMLYRKTVVEVLMDLAGVNSVYLFGDSVGRGIVLDANGKYSPISESFAPAAAKKLGIALQNKARFGCTIGKGLEILKRCLAREVLPEQSAPMPQVAILEFGGNDCDFDWRAIAQAPEAPHLPATPLDAFGVAYEAAIQALRARQIVPLAMTLPPLDPERYFRWFTKAGLDGAAILKWLGSIQNIFLWHEGYDKEVRRIAAASGTAIIDIRKAFLSTPDYRQYLCEDGIHPNREGHGLMERTILDFAAMQSGERALLRA
jgi:lysophospholipase L1-like esterase